MKRVARLVISFALALVVVPFLPLYIERTLLLRGLRSAKINFDLV
jgi:hypothetical protein